MISSNPHSTTQAEAYRKLRFTDSFLSGLQFKGKALSRVSWHTQPVSVAIAEHMHRRCVSAPGRFAYPLKPPRVVFAANDSLEIEDTDVVFGIGVPRVGCNEIVLKRPTTTPPRAQTIVVHSPQPFVSVYTAKVSCPL